MHGSSHGWYDGWDVGRDIMDLFYTAPPFKYKFQNNRENNQ
jgi:hypothetical protein